MIVEILLIFSDKAVSLVSAPDGWWRRRAFVADAGRRSSKADVNLNKAEHLGGCIALLHRWVAMRGGGSADSIVIEGKTSWKNGMTLFS